MAPIAPGTPPQPVHDSAEEILGGYRAVNVLAVIGFALGCLSGLALLGPTLWMLPLAGLLFNWRALYGMSRARHAQAGRGIATLGLFLSVTFGVAGPVDLWSSRRHLEQSSAPVADAWLAALAHNRPEAAHQLTLTAMLRQPPAVDLARYYRTHKTAHDQLQHYVADPVVKTLLLLGERAEVRLYAVSVPVAAEQQDVLARTYAVTFDDQGTKTTFFVAMTLQRRMDKSQQALWRVDEVVGGVKPPSWLD